MADQTVNTNQYSTLDYELTTDVMQLSTPEQFKAIGDTTRNKILGLLGQRAATTKQIGEALKLPKGTAGHHLKVLEAAGLIRVVRTRQVRAITEKYYGRTARLYRSSSEPCMPGTQPGAFVIPVEVSTLPLRQALEEFAPSPDNDDPSTFMLTHARIPASQARAFALRLEALADEFSQKPTPGEKVYGLVAGVYLTGWPDLSELPEEAGE